MRSYQFLARTNPDPERDNAGVQCFYEEEEDGEGIDDRDRQRQGSGGGSVSKADGVDAHATVRKLEAKVGKSCSSLPVDQKEYTLTWSRGTTKGTIGWSCGIQPDPRYLTRSRLDRLLPPAPVILPGYRPNFTARALRLDRIELP